MSKKREPKSIESFGPEIFEALIEGSKREIVLELPYAKAIAFRQRANSLRAAMRDAKHEHLKIVAQTTLRIVWGKAAGYEEDVPEKRNSQNVRFPVNRATPAKLIISPADSEFGDALRAAGVTLRPLTGDSPSHTETPDTKPFADDILEQFLRGEPDA